MIRPKPVAIALLVLASVARSALAIEIDPKLEAAIRAKAAEVLTDPYSAVFSFDTMRPLKNNVGTVCGTVNAKNLFGAYVGRRLFVAIYIAAGDEFVVVKFATPDFSLDYARANTELCG